mgnify:CR=1 FL=1
MRLLETIENLIRVSCPGYSFEFDTDRMMNVEADDIKFPCVFFEEYTDGRISGTYLKQKQVTVELSFMDLAEFQCDAREREEIRERLEQDAVLPFIRALELSDDFDQISDFTIMAEPPRFDANCVSLLLRFDVTFDLCV